LKVQKMEGGGLVDSRFQGEKGRGADTNPGTTIPSLRSDRVYRSHTCRMERYCSERVTSLCKAEDEVCEEMSASKDSSSVAQHRVLLQYPRRHLECLSARWRSFRNRFREKTKCDLRLRLDEVADFLTSFKQAGGLTAATESPQYLFRCCRDEHQPGSDGIVRPAKRQREEQSSRNLRIRACHMKCWHPCDIVTLR